MHSFYSFDFVLKLPVHRITQLLFKVIEKQNERMVRDRWLSLYPYMEMRKLNFVTYSDYKDKLIQAKKRYTDITNEQIDAELSAVMRAHEGR